MIELKSISINVLSGSKAFEFSCKFEPGFNVIRADNSQGKSTLMAAILYGLGFEEILGGKNESALPHALCKAILDKNSEVGDEITSSEVWIEYTNGTEVRTNRRSIVNPGKSSKLIEVFMGGKISNPTSNISKHDYYIHDKNSAQSIDAGYFAYIERFIGFDLPDITAQDGRTSKLYIQYVAAAALIEQRLGWTSYIANIPYFGIKDARQKTIEFILGLESLNRDAERRRLQSELVELQENWIELSTQIRTAYENESLAVQGLSKSLDYSFTRKGFSVVKPTPSGAIEIGDHIELLQLELEKITQSQNIVDATNSSDERALVASLVDSLSSLIDAERRLAFSQRSSLSENQELEKALIEVELDLLRNKAAKKIREYGGDFNIHSSSSHCPLCTQSISDDIDLPSETFDVMSLDDNISYLESQRKLIRSTVQSNIGFSDDAGKRLAETQKRIRETNTQLSFIKREIAQREGVIPESTIYKKVKLESEILAITSTIDKQTIALASLEQISQRGGDVSSKIKSIDPGKLTGNDFSVVAKFAKEIKRLLGMFKFSSFSTDLVALDDDKLIPIIKYNEIQSEISGGNIQEITAIATGSATSRTEKAASASDFVRLIWAFTLALRNCSDKRKRTHFGLILLDEPQQHSMSNDSVRALFSECAANTYQTIIAASFDCSEANYNQITNGVNFNLIRFEGKLLQRQ